MWPLSLQLLGKEVFNRSLSLLAFSRFYGKVSVRISQIFVWSLKNYLNREAYGLGSERRRGDRRWPFFKSLPWVSSSRELWASPAPPAAPGPPTQGFVVRVPVLSRWDHASYGTLFSWKGYFLPLSWYLHLLMNGFRILLCTRITQWDSKIPPKSAYIVRSRGCAPSPTCWCGGNGEQRTACLHIPWGTEGALLSLTLPGYRWRQYCAWLFIG